MIRRFFFVAFALLVLCACVTRQIADPGSGALILLGPQCVEGGLEFRVLVKDAARTLSVAGSFNSWRPAEFFLTNTPSLRLWSGFVPMTNRGEIQFKYIRDGYDWRTDPTTGTVPDGMGGRNSVFRFPAPLTNG